MRFKIILLCLLTMSICILGLVPSVKAEPTDQKKLSAVKQASMVKLIAFPFRYLNAKVKIGGYVHLQEGMNGIYLTGKTHDTEILRMVFGSK